MNSVFPEAQIATGARIVEALLDKYPVTAIIAAPGDEKSAAILRGRYVGGEGDGETRQILSPDEVVADLATHTPVLQADRVLLDRGNQVGIDVDSPEVIDQHTDFETVVAIENPIQQRGLARTKEAGEQGDGHGFPGR